MNSLHIVVGPPGSGKTTYGKKLAKDLNAAFLDIDTVTEKLVQSAQSYAGKDPNDRDSPEFKEAFRMPIYDTLFAIAKENLPSTDVVLTGPFTAESRDASWLDKLKSDFQTNVQIHHVYCSVEERLQRMKERNNPRDLPKLADWESYIQYYGEEKRPPFPHVYIDTSS